MHAEVVICVEAPCASACARQRWFSRNMQIDRHSVFRLARFGLADVPFARLPVFVSWPGRADAGPAEF